MDASVWIVVFITGLTSESKGFSVLITGKPLTKMAILVLGKLSKNKEEIKALIEELGGKTTGSVNKATVCVSTTSKYQAGPLLAVYTQDSVAFLKVTCFVY